MNESSDTRQISFISPGILRIRQGSGTGPSGMPSSILSDDFPWKDLDASSAEQLLKESGLTLGSATQGEADTAGFRKVRQPFTITDDAVALYGLGQFEDGIVNWRGQSCHIVQQYIGSPCPLLVSTGGWAILWPALCESRFEDSSEGMVFTAEAVPALEFYILLGDSIDEQIALYRKLSGQAPLMPKYFYGFWQFYNRYKNFQEIHDVVDEYRRRELPLDAVVQDWKYWKEEANEEWNSLELEPSRFPDPVGNIQKIHDRKVKFMMTLWPTMGIATDNWRRMKAAGFLLEGVSLCEGAAGVYDAFNPEARELYWSLIRDKMLAIGVDSLWMDGTEPDCGATGAGADSPYHENFEHAGETAVGPVQTVLNAYPLATTDGVYGNWRKERKDRCCILTRASHAGIQRNAAAVWSGDTKCRWEDYKRQIPMGINLCMAGVPYWTHDIGGWLWEKDLYPECAQDPAFAELHTRWFQLGVFTPMCRIHGSWSPREIYRFPEPFYSAHVKFLELRARMLPYIYSLAWRITNEGYTLMRGLAMDFPNDPKVHQITDQYMFGPAFLVCPVLEPMLYPAPEYGEEASERMNRSGEVEVYLPAGTDWFDFWTGEKFEGGQTLRVVAPIDSMPLFVRAGSIVPLGPVKNYAEELDADALEIRVYPGRDASFTLYDDDGATYDYEQGNYRTRELHWNERLQQLQGALPEETIQFNQHTN